MIEKGLNQHNFMPGTERYTRPEEVKALNKFLKSVKETQEEHTEVSEDNLVLPGSPKIPEVGLDSRRVDVNGVLSQVDRLVEGRLNINPGNDIKSLEDAKINIEDTRENTLQTTRETIISKEQSSLEDTRVDISEGNDPEMENKRLDLETTQIESLEDSILGITNDFTPELNTTTENIPTKGEGLQVENISKLSEEKQILETSGEENSSKDQELSGTKLEIQDNTEVTNLENEKISISDKRTTKLESEILEITDKTQPGKLEDTKETILGKEIKSLETTKETITPGKDKTLETTKLKIQENSIDSLSDDKLEIQENTVNSLETNRETITKNDLGELETESLKIQENSIDSLSDDKLTINSEEVDNLETEILGFQASEIDSLGDVKEEIQENSIDSLSDDIKTIDSSEVENLDETRKDIQENQVESLSTTRQDLASKDNTNLETKKSGLQVDSKVEDLESKIIEGPGENGVSELENLVSGLSVNSKVSDLSTSRIDINPAQDNSLSENQEDLGVEEKVSDLENSLESLDIEEKVNSLSGVIIEGPETNEKDLDTSVVDLDKGEEKIDSLDTTIITGPTSNNPESLEDAVISLTKPEDQELETAREELKTSGDQNSLEDFIDTLDSPEDINLDETQITIDPSSNYSGVLEDTIIEDPGNADLSGRTYSDGSYSLSDVELKDTQIGLKDNRRSLEDLEDEKLMIFGVENYEGDQGNSNFYDKLSENKISGIQDPGLPGRTISDSTKYKLSEVKLKYDSIELDPGDSDDIELLEESSRKNLSEGQGYSQENRTANNRDYNILDISSKENLKEYEDLSKIATSEGHSLGNRTITDLDLTVKDSDYVMSMINNVSKKGDKADILVPENSIDNRTSNNDDYSTIEIKEKEDLENYRKKETSIPENADLSGRTIIDLDKTVKDPEYTIKNASKVSTRGDKSGTSIPENQSSKEIDSLDGIGELKTSDKYKNGQSGDHGYLTPGYKLPEIGWKNFWDGGALSPSTYLRWATENTVGKIPLKGAMKGKLIDETLALLVIAREKLEKVTKANRERLPGGDMGLLSSLANGSLSVKSAAKSVLGAVGKALSTSTVDKSQPINRPSGKQKSWEAPGQEVLDSTVSTSKGGGGFFKKLGKALTGGSLGSDGGQRDFNTLVNSSFNISDFSGEDALGIGFGRTLTDLIGSDSDISSLEGFKEAIKNSRYITSPKKFTSTSDSTTYMTLDSNHIWEVVFKPYSGKLNGSKTWLPSFYEIDKQNKKAFNVTTRYSSGWLPITGFELQEKKLTSKELPLFNGSISFPIGLEFTNELRLTFADDSLKSLKRYFDLCTKVSAYMSNIHTEGEPGYLFPEDDLSVDIDNPTVYLEGKIHPGLYKNLSFIITIFILTPQLGTIKKCNLLCVIKDYTIENQGETDSSPTELNVTFSIVGENPQDVEDNALGIYNYTPAVDSTKRKYTFERSGTEILDNLGSVVNIF